MNRRACDRPAVPGRRSLLGFFVGSIAFALPASASTEIRVDKKGIVKTTAEHVLDVLSASDVCDKACKYYGPNIAREVKLTHRATETSFYKWTHVSGIKSVKFFKHYQVTKGPTMKIAIRILTEEHDKALISELKAKTGLEHAPLFESSRGDYTITPRGDAVEIDIRTRTRVGGLLSVLSGTIRRETERSLDALFENFAR